MARVLEIAQELYENKWITYPRTDSAYITEAMKKETYALALNLASPEQKKVFREEKEKFSFVNDKKVTDHYAIIPTSVKPQNLTPEQSTVYGLIHERFLMAWMKPYTWEKPPWFTLRGRKRLKLKLEQGYPIMSRVSKNRRK